MTVPGQGPVRLCRLDDIADGGSAGFSLGKGESRVGILVVRRGNRVHAYRNACPHVGAPLDFTPGKFLNLERTHILCANHGALFRIDDGLCVAGPCVGQKLESLPASVTGGIVWING